MKTTRLTIRSLVCLLLSLSLCVSLVTAAFAESPTELTSDEAISTEASTTESISATEGSATESISATEGTALETSATAEGDAALADEDEDAVTSFEISSSIDNEDFNLFQSDIDEFQKYIDLAIIDINNTLESPLDVDYYVNKYLYEEKQKKCHEILENYKGFLN